jgi:hypothetical protein
MLDGGLGIDTLVLTGKDNIFWFFDLPDNKVRSIEAIDFSGSGDNILSLPIRDVLNFSHTPNPDFTGAASHNSLVIIGDAGDMLHLPGFKAGDMDVHLDGTAGGDFNIYNYERNGVVVATVAAHHSVAMDGLV